MSEMYVFYSFILYFVRAYLCLCSNSYVVLALKNTKTKKYLAYHPYFVYKSGFSLLKGNKFVLLTLEF